MDTGDLRIVPVEENETSTENVNRNRDEDEELRAKPGDSNRNEVLCRRLQDTSGDVQPRPPNELETLWHEIKEQDNVQQLLGRVENLKCVRLLESLVKTAGQFERCAKYGNAARLICSATDIAGTAGGLFMRDTSFDHSNLAFAAATALGTLGLGFTVGETWFLYDRIEDIMSQIQEYKDLFTSIQQWFQQTEKLEKAFKDMLPIDNTNATIRKLKKAKEAKFSGKDVFENVVEKIVKDKGVKQKKDAMWFETAWNLLSMKEIKRLLQGILIPECPIYLDIARIMIQFQYTPRFFFCQSIPALSPKDQTLWSFPVWTRMSLNVLTMKHASVMLRRPEICAVASEMRLLRNELYAQWTALDQIVQYVEERGNRQYF